MLIQAVILENGPEGNLHVAVPVPELAGRIFKKYYSSRISRITLFMIFSLLLLFKLPQIFKMNPVVAGIWLRNWTRQ